MIKTTIAAISDTENIKWLLKQGFSAVMLVLVLWWVATYWIGPMQAAHLNLVSETIETQKDLTECCKKQTRLSEEILNRLQ